MISAPLRKCWANVSRKKPGQIFGLPPGSTDRPLKRGNFLIYSRMRRSKKGIRQFGDGQHQNNHRQGKSQFIKVAA